MRAGGTKEGREREGERERERSGEMRLALWRGFSWRVGMFHW